MSHAKNRKRLLAARRIKRQSKHLLTKVNQSTKEGVTMLVLTRNKNESIIIHTLDGIIEVSVNQVKGGQVKLGITAPAEVLIMRKEIDDSTEYESN